MIFQTRFSRVRLLALTLCNIQHDNKEDFGYACNHCINKFAIYINIIM